MLIKAPQQCGCPLQEESISLTESPICAYSSFAFMVLLEAYLRGRCKITEPCKKFNSEEDVQTEYDFIVVGAGSAGAIVAGRLSENFDHSVLLIEAGGEEPTAARPPSLYRSFWHTDIDWKFRTQPGDYCLDQRGKGCLWPRGKVFGGTSVLNGMMYHRGHPADYEDWVKAGATGWSWEENVPYFNKTEGNKQIGSLVSPQYHSASGPLPVQQFRFQPEAVRVLLHAINESGLPIIQDMNDLSTPYGFTLAQTFNDNGQRYTTARAFLEPHRDRPNLSVKLNALVTRVLFENTGYSNVAYGVEFKDKDGTKRVVRARKEVILSAGALNTPQILMLSGIGPKDTLDKFGIPLIADLPVGANLRNHIGVTFNFILTKLENLDVLDWNVLTEYLLEQTGAMSGDGTTQVTGLLYSSLGDVNRDQPDLQFFFNGFYAECSKNGEIGEPTRGNNAGKNISANAVSLIPRSVGYITLNSTNPEDPPLFYPEYFTHPDDMVMVKDAARYLKRIYDTDLMQNKYGIILDPTYTTECSRSGAEWSDRWLECMARVYTDPQNHQCGTAAISLVLDPDLKVRNVEGLRVIDASSMPLAPTGNPQGAIMMVAERGAACIMEQWS